jgi:hypothetical protein
MGTGIGREKRRRHDKPGLAWHQPLVRNAGAANFLTLLGAKKTIALRDSVPQGFGFDSAGGFPPTPN